jgi:hypothetical protein
LQLFVLLFFHADLSCDSRVCTLAQVIYGSIIVHRMRKGVYNYDLSIENAFNDGQGPVTYESAENGIKMETQPVPPVYR